ncbi:hypothetical protein FHX37_1660 [Haloactinospora alba]|uniref:Uncharacterized protein n=1 Tax=Haloactinospora alba TaxID=405555 RepID=A0A543NJ17_9ACTN|nr:pyroglutamyl peptidase [Haloactinospora alba]TQN31740.1 hypothetical protein FHX37_1660 [Haloactinospora alba]
MSATTATVEESRAELETPQLILRRSGFAAAAPLFSADLAAASDLDQATQTVSSHGRRLWSEAARQETTDDRVLYWARLALIARLRSWQPSFQLGQRDRAALITRLEHASRGHDDLVFPPDDRLLGVIVTGFDPCGLDADIRASNSSGVAALALHGATFDLDGHTVVVRTALFPVRWRDFTGGMVESALSPHYTGGDGGTAPANAVVALGQGDEDCFVLETHSAAWRSDAADNEDVRAPGPVPLTGSGTPGPQWARSSLPHRTMVTESSGNVPVRENTSVVEVPAGSEEPVLRSDGPTAGSRAREGSGGNGLFNELAYRGAVLRDAASRNVPTGHIRTPPLRSGSDERRETTGPGIGISRAELVEQVRGMVPAALGGSTDTD